MLIRTSNPFTAIDQSKNQVRKQSTQNGGNDVF